MSHPNDLSRCLVSLEQDTTLIAVIELSQSSWLIAGNVPGVERQPLKKIVPDEVALLRRSLSGAQAGKDGSSGHRMLTRGFLGWLRGERGHCAM